MIGNEGTLYTPVALEAATVRAVVAPSVLPGSLLGQVLLYTAFGSLLLTAQELCRQKKAWEHRLLHTLAAAASSAAAERLLAEKASQARRIEFASGAMCQVINTMTLSFTVHTLFVAQNVDTSVKRMQTIPEPKQCLCCISASR